MMEKWNDQKTPALAIVARGDQIQTITPNQKYKVKSQSTLDRYYDITQNENQYDCTCEHHKTVKRNCIHILAVKFQQTLKNTQQETLMETIKCDKCGSTQIVKNGTRKNKSGMINRHLCKECGYRFTDNNGFKKRRNEPEKIALALDLYFRGLSVRKISEHFQQVHNLRISHMTVYRWIYTYSKIASEWMDKQNTPTSETWHIDETILGVNGEKRFLWNVMDSESRYLLAMHVSKDRSLVNTMTPINKAKKATQDRPQEVLTDGMVTYPKAIRKTLGGHKKGSRTYWNPQRVVPSIKAKISNNRIERLHGTEKERTKVMRGFDQEHGCQTLMEGFRVHYNLVKKHQTLGCTPSEATGKLSLEGFKWLQIIKKAINQGDRCSKYICCQKLQSESD